MVGIFFLFIGTAIIASNAQNIEKSSAESIGNTIYVDDDNIEGPWDGTIEHPFQTIQDGINASTNSDTVYVFTGIYVSINVTKSIDLIGEDKESTIINGEIKVRAIHVNVSFFTVFNEGRYCIDLEDVYFCNISNNIVKSTGHSNTIGIYHSSNNILSKNIIFNTARAMHIKENNIIKGNKIKNNGYGFEFYGDNNLVYENNISFNTGIGLCIFDDSDGNSIIRNTIYSNVGIPYVNNAYGVVVGGNKNIISSNNIIKNEFNARFWVLPLQKNTWDKNYWGNPVWMKIKVIPGWVVILYLEDFFPGIELPWLNFDWHPAQEPYDIPGMT